MNIKQMDAINFIDAHAHLFPRWFKNKTDLIANRAKKDCITVINSAIDPQDYDFGIQFAEKHENIHLTLGLAPQGIVRYNIDVNHTVGLIKKHHSKIIAIGEVGLDYHWVKDIQGQQIQHKAFIQTINLANQLHLPIFVHSRKAEKECIEILDETAKTDVILHCFAGSVPQALEAVEKGWFISIPTAVTTRKIHRRLAREIPLENLLVETDSPFLSPIPSIKQNTPIFISYAVDEVAKLKNIPSSKVQQTTTENCFQLFNIKE